jgi:hydroxyacylglutathione hydrolase
MFFQRINTDGLAQVSFVIGSDVAQQAIVIDPRRDVEIYLETAAAHGLTITHIFETHVHADYASGARELTARTGATCYLSELGQSEFPHTPVRDGDEFEVGELSVSVLLTPGHTPEHICILLRDTSDSSATPLLFSGDTIFVGGVGRPDLLGEAQTRALAEGLYDSIQHKLMALDDEIIVYPGHGAGSACGKSIGNEPSTTMGQEKRFNYAFQPMDCDAFVALMLDGLPEPPPYFPIMKQLNKRGPDVLGGVPAPAELSTDDLRAAQAGRRELTLLDVRDADTFGAGFLRGALNIGLGPSLPNWAGWAVPYDRPIALIVEREADVAEAVTWLIRIGLDDVAGFVVADAAGWRAAGLDVAVVEQLQPDEAQALIARGELHVLDVRNVDEWEQGHIESAHHVPVGHLARGEGNGITPDAPVAVVCAAGYRSSLGSSVLAARGYERVVNVSGGMGAWQAAGLPVRS